MATIGQQLTSPEIGWKRHNMPTAKYSEGVWENYGNSYFRSANLNAKISFKFTGTKLRIVTTMWSDHSNKISISIDGTTEVYSESTSETRQALVFEKLGLIDGLHYVEISNATNKYITLSDIDIDSTGRLFHSDEVTNIKDLSVGKRIRCHYKSAVAGTIGAFSGLGQETSNFIPSTSSATPDGDFYFIMAEDWNKKKMLIPDRNIQHSISWDVLNSAGIASGSGAILDFQCVPTMNANDTLEMAVEGSQYNANYPPYKLFDGQFGASDGMFWASATAGVETVTITFKNKTPIINKYNLYPRVGYLDAAPKDWYFYGSNDKTNWVKLDSRVGESKWSSLSSPNSYLFQNDKAYKYYKFVFSKNNGNPLFYELSEIVLAEKKNYSSTTRLLTGGTSASDTDNEWDKYIVNSTLNGTITAGDNSVWNSSYLYTYTSTTHSSGSGNRVSRATTKSGLVAYGSAVSNTVYANSGFRPVLIIEMSTGNKSFILFNGGYKKWNTENKVWQTVSTTLPSLDTFISDGMDDLSVFDRKATTIVQSTTANGSLGSGKMFKGNIDLKKYFEITNVTVK
ncbi:discoidin domain-containing protein [Paenibacillus tuaregi]|uniref:discoidin domain-containing protein n=1 Tax=Paenibacillus tuaregi TaxID=1816681 RepID=UPI0008387739|nr:discoidin domain-containing protein [Paenibacillus tuaregi]